MKKKVMIILLFILCIFASSCSIFKDYVIDGYDKILTEKGYSIQTDINEINNKVESYIYKWNIISENEVISPRGSYIKKEDDSIFIRTPSLIDITIEEDENNIMMLEEDGIKYYVSKDLSVYSTLDRARVDILKVYKYEDYYILVVDNKYVYAVSDDLKRAFVNEDLSRTFLYGEDRVALDCANLYENVSKTSYYYININNKEIVYYLKYDSEFAFYLIGIKPTEFVSDLENRSYNVYEVDRSYMLDTDNNNIWYLYSEDENMCLKVSYEVLGKENEITTKVEVFNIKEKKLKEGYISKEDNWNDNTLNVMNNKNINIPFYNIGKFYLINSELEDSNIAPSIQANDSKCYKIYDNYYKPILEEYKKVLEENGFLPYDMPVNLKPSEGEEYSEWRAAYNFWLSTGDSIYFDAYINEDKNIYIKITFDVNKGNIIEIYTLK